MRKFILIFSLLFLLFSLSSHSQTLISAFQAKEYSTQECVVEGWVHDVKVIQNEKGGVAFIHFEKAYPENPFKVVIFGRQFDKFPENLQAYYSQKRVRIRGIISTDAKGTPQIIANEASDILIVEVIERE